MAESACRDDGVLCARSSVWPRGPRRCCLAVVSEERETGQGRSRRSRQRGDVDGDGDGGSKECSVPSSSSPSVILRCDHRTDV